MRESEVQFSRWIFKKKESTRWSVALSSAILHVLIFLCAYYVKPNKEVTSNQTPSAVHVSFAKPTQAKNTPVPIVQNSSSKATQINPKEILTDNNKNSHAKFDSPQHSRKKKSELEKNKEALSLQKTQFLKEFLPSSNADYVQNLREESPTQPVQGDAGDIPIEGPSLAPTNEPRIVSRFSQKDMSLFQFTQEFRERFGAVWNAEDRFVPPSSPLRPGDVVYYKVYILSSGALEKFDNLSKKTHPQKDYAEIDKIFSQVISKVFPMVVPPKFANKNVTLTQVVAIQVVDRTSPIHFSF